MEKRICFSIHLSMGFDVDQMWNSIHMIEIELGVGYYKDAGAGIYTIHTLYVIYTNINWEFKYTIIAHTFTQLMIQITIITIIATIEKRKYLRDVKLSWLSC